LLALSLATRARFATPPNPRVGCVITDDAGTVLGQGHTQQAGGAHAEIMALRDAAAKGLSVKGATAFVTLEPCSHHGRTGPCCDALIAAGIGKVVATNIDPNPLVAGQGFARLRAAGVEVQVLPTNDPLAIQARELNIGFFSRMIRKRPWVRMKLAASLDGQTALPNGVSQWITSPQARADGHAWRARSCAVLTGIGTVLADNPKLDVRLVQTPRQPTLVLLDSRLRVPLEASVFTAERPRIVYTAAANEAKKQALRARAVSVVELPTEGPDAHKQVDLVAMLRDLARREINELHIEAGPRLNLAFIRAQLVDEFLLYLAPKLLGQGQAMTPLGPFTTLAEAVTLRFESVEQIGPDLRLLARPSLTAH